MNTTDHDAHEVVRRVQLGKGRQVTLSAEVRDVLQVDTGDDVEFTVHPNGDVTLRCWTTE
ncbi:MAG: AbrB/MazE/SpoVT family DNA-binding domain-containing protein [Actinomycetota bacterium]|nr:AbrB/MazE/SpoVT family DNA-binding domain-containing protein [Actinomycetota bacterium]